MNIEKPWLARCTTRVPAVCVPITAALEAGGAHGTPNVAELDDVKTPSVLRLLHGVYPYGRKHTIHGERRSPRCKNA